VLFVKFASPRHIVTNVGSSLCVGRRVVTKDFMKPYQVAMRESHVILFGALW
jgi:hypothetical protein